MKIAVTATAESPAQAIDQRFGRARLFLVNDSETGQWTVIDNSQDYQAAHGAGVQSARHIVDSGATALVTGNCGPKAFAVLKAAGVAVYQGFTGTAEEAVAAVHAGSLTASHRENVAANHGSV